MANENGTWIMYGVSADNPDCIHTVQELISFIEKVGFLPLFKNEIPGFSVEERTVPQDWWSDRPENDPWMWREIIARSGQVAYGKFFDKKAGFISREWLPYFVNYRRNGYDFDALWDDEKASRKQKKIMDLFEGKDTELFSFEVRQKAGFGKGGESNFEGSITSLLMQTYLCIKDFRKKRSRKGRKYGMAVAVYSRPESVWGYDFVRSAYKEDPLDSGRRIVGRLLEYFPEAGEGPIRKALGPLAGEMPGKQQRKAAPDYPGNLFAALKLNISEVTKDQLIGLEYVLGLLPEREWEMIRLHYELGLSYRLIAERCGLSESRCSQIVANALRKMKAADNIGRIREGYTAFEQMEHKKNRK